MVGLAQDASKRVSNFSRRTMIVPLGMLDLGVSLQDMLRSVLAMITDPSEILKVLVDTGQTVRDGRLAGAFRNIGRADFADEIMGTMKRIGYDVREEDPFAEVIKVGLVWNGMERDFLEMILKRIKDLV